STSIDAPVPPVVEAARQGAVAGLRIGIVSEFSGDGYQPGVMSRFTEAVEVLEALGAKVTEVSCPHFKYALPAYYLIAPSEVSSNLARFDGMRYGLRAGSGSAEEVMAISREAGFGHVDVLISPPPPTTAFDIGERADDPMAMYLADLCTIPSNLAGNAAISVPVGLAPEDGLPVGLQVMAPPLADDRLYRVAAAVEAAFTERWGHPLLTEAKGLSGE